MTSEAKNSIVIYATQQSSQDNGFTIDERGRPTCSYVGFESEECFVAYQNYIWSETDNRQNVIKVPGEMVYSRVFKYIGKSFYSEAFEFVHEGIQYKAFGMKSWIAHEQDLEYAQN